MPYWYPILYYLKPTDLDVKSPGGKSSRKPGRKFPNVIHKIRDGLAHFELSRVFQEEGYQYGGPILQVPKIHQTSAEIPRQFGTNDLLVQATRPPDFARSDFHPEDGGLRSLGIAASNSSIEAYVAVQMMRFLEKCNRELVIIRDDQTLDDEKYRKIKFRVKGGGNAERFNRKEITEKNIAVGYLAGFPSNQGMPRLLVAFSLGGTETLWFCHLLSLDTNDGSEQTKNENKRTLKEAMTTPTPRLWIIEFTFPPEGFLLSPSTMFTSKCAVNACVEVTPKSRRPE